MCQTHQRIKKKSLDIFSIRRLSLNRTFFIFALLQEHDSKIADILFARPFKHDLGVELFAS